MATDRMWLVRAGRPAPRDLRRRTIFIGLALAAVLLAGLLVWGLRPLSETERPVVISAPGGARLAVDGQAVPALAADGTILLRLAPGPHNLELTLRNQTVVTTQLDVKDDPLALQLELRFDRDYGRWHLQQLGAADGNEQGQTGKGR